MSPQRRDSGGQREIGPTWESLIERQIREATEAGAFDDLPHQGERLPLEDDSAAGEWAMAHRMLKNAGVAPPWIESDKEARRRLEALERLLVARRGRLGRLAAAAAAGARDARGRGQPGDRPGQQRSADRATASTRPGTRRRGGAARGGVSRRTEAGTAKPARGDGPASPRDWSIRRSGPAGRASGGRGRSPGGGRR